jgi:hypothetical protein
MRVDTSIMPAVTAIPVGSPPEETPAAGRPRRVPWAPAMTTLYAAAWMMFGWGAGQRRLTDNSFLWHLRTGHWILAHGVPRTDPYSFTAHGVPWVAQSWLAEVGYAGLDDLGGAVALRLFGAVVGLAVALLSFRLVLRLGRDRLVAAFLPFTAVVASGMFWSERPLFLGALAMLALVWIVEVPGSRAGRHPLLTVPPLMWVWANVHGSFALGFVYLALHVAGRWADGAPPWRGRERVLVRATALAAALGFVNPYGYRLMWFPVHLLMRGGVLRVIVEWRSPDFRTPQGAVFGAFLAVLIGVLALARGRPSRRDVLVLLPFVLMALWAQRNIALAPLVALPILARMVARERPRPDEPRRLNWAFLAVIVAIGVAWTAAALPRPAFGPGGGYPIAAMRALDRDGLIGRRMLTTDAWAGYVIYRYWPRQHVFIDDRYDMYPTGLAKEYFQVLDGAPEWRSVLDRHHIDVVVWRKDAPISQYLAADPAWRRIYVDDRAATYVRR